MPPPAPATGYRQRILTSIFTAAAGTTTNIYLGPIGGYPWLEALRLLTMAPVTPGSVWVAYWIPQPPPPNYGFEAAVPLSEPALPPKSAAEPNALMLHRYRGYAPYARPAIRIGVFNNGATAIPIMAIATLYTNDLVTPPERRYAVVGDHLAR